MVARPVRGVRIRPGKLPEESCEGLISFAEHQFRLSIRLPDGSTRLATLESVQRQTGKQPKGLEGPECPAELWHIWKWFLDLAGARGGGFGPAPISWSDMMAWSILTWAMPTPQEVDQILALDRLWLKVQEDSRPKNRPPGGPRPAGARQRAAYQR